VYKDYYQILEISILANQAEIKKAYHKKAMQFHPDRNAWFQKEAEAQMKLVNEAFAILSDKEQKRYYDLYEYQNDFDIEQEEESDFKEAKFSNVQSENNNPVNQWYRYSIQNMLSWFIKKIYQLFLQFPYAVRFFIVIIFISWMSTFFDESSDKLNKFDTINTVNQVAENNELTKNVSNAGSIDDLWKAYCNMYRIVNLYSIAPDSKFYSRSVENNSDVSSQKMIAPILIAERSILWQNDLLNKISTSSGSFQHTASLIKESDTYLLNFLKNMQSISNLNDFKSNVLSNYSVSRSLLKSIPNEFKKEYQSSKHQNSDDLGMLFKDDENGMLCNTNIDMSFWDKDLESINAEVDELGSREIMQDVNFREEPGMNGKIIRPLIRWEYVTVLDKKEIWNMTWYFVKENNTKWWVSSLAFVEDPSKASAANCDPINGYIDEKGYCNCKNGFEWSRETISCKRISETSNIGSIVIDRPLSVWEVKIDRPTSIYSPVTNPSLVPVNGYFKSNGTYVQPYYRTAPNDTKLDNLSY